MAIYTTKIRHNVCLDLHFCNAGALHTLTLLGVCIVTFLLMACSREDSFSYKSSNEALSSYNDLLTEVKDVKVSSADEFIALCKRWHTQRDSVVSAINRDIHADNRQCMESCMNSNDSIREALVRLVDTLPLSFTDYINFREAVSDVRIKEDERALIDRYSRFFASLDDNKILDIGTNAFLRNYELFIRNSLKLDNYRKSDIMKFFKEEDVMFRTFLTHLPDLGSTSLSGLRTDTEKMCGLIFKNVSTAKSSADSLTKEEAVVLMTMRSNRRLIQNAEVCIDDVRQGKISDESQSAAYLWMLLQPILSLDDFSLALLTPRQRNSLDKLAKELPDIEKKLQSKDYDLPIDISELPALLTKAYIHKTL